MGDETIIPDSQITIIPNKGIKADLRPTRDNSWNGLTNEETTITIDLTADKSTPVMVNYHIFIIIKAKKFWQTTM